MYLNSHIKIHYMEHSFLKNVPIWNTIQKIPFKKSKFIETLDISVQTVNEMVTVGTQYNIEDFEDWVVINQEI